MEHPREPGRPLHERPDVQPLSRRASRILVVVAVLLIVGLAFASAYLLIDTAEKAQGPPDAQEETLPGDVP